MPPPDPQVLAQQEGLRKIFASIQLLRDQKLRGFRVDIEVDSTIFGDAAQEKADRTEFLAAVTGFMEKAMQISAQMPEATPLMGKFLQFGVRGFRVGRDLEAAIEDFCDLAEEASKRMAAQKASQPSPEQLKAQADQAKAQAQIQTTQMKGQIDQQKMQGEMANTKLKIQGDQQQAAAEVQRQQAETQGEVFNSQVDLQDKQYDMRIKQLEMQIENMRLQSDLAKAHASVEAARNQPMPQPPPGLV